MTVLDILNQWFFPVIVAIMGCYLFWEKRNNRKGNTPIHEESEEKPQRRDVSPISMMGYQ